MAAALLDRLRVPAPEIHYASLERAPSWVAGRLDACPKASCKGPYATPALWAIKGDALVCVYQCSRCQRAWWTSWSIPSLGVEVPA